MVPPLTSRPSIGWAGRVQMLTTAQIDGAALYDILVVAYARANYFSPDTMAVLKELIEERLTKSQKEAFLAFITAAEKDD